MNANAFDAMIVPVIRGVFLAAILGGGVIGLARMFGAIAASFRAPGEEAAGRSPRPAAEVVEDEFATAGA